MPDDAAVLGRLERLFVQILSVEPPDPRADLIEGGVLDSLALVELLGAIEGEFEIEIPLDEFDVERFRTTERLAGFVSELMAAAAGSR
jgi:acyl carrier protein